MPDLSPDTFQRFPDPTVLLAALLETLGDPPVIPAETLDRHAREHDPAVEIAVEQYPGRAVIRLRRRETYLERLTRLLREVYDDPSTSHAQDAETILLALGADPDRLAP